MPNIRWLAWTLPVALALVAAVLWGLGFPRQVTADSWQDLILFRYPGSGWGTIATGYSETYAVNDDLPVYNDEGANIRLAVDDAVDAWNETRQWEGGGINYLWKTGFYPAANVKFSGLGGGTLVYRLTAEEDCELPDPPAEHCLTETWLGDDLAQNPLTGSIVHELGHALGSLKDIDTWDYWTIMGYRWNLMTEPTDADAQAMWEVHGIPSHPSLSAKPGYPTIAVATAQDHSTYDTHVIFFLEKWSGSAWILGSYYWGEMLGTFYRLEEDVVETSGPGLYRFRVYVYNQFPNDKTGWIFGGYTNSVYFSSPPPSPPSWVSISGSAGNGSVSWGHVSGATYYNVFVERWYSGNPVTLLNWVYDTASPRSFSYSVSDWYHAAVKACNASGCSSQTNSSPYWVWLEAGPLLLLEDYFSSGSINTSLWGTAVGGGATIVQSGGYLQMSIPDVANAYADLYSKSYFAVGTTFEARVWVGSGQSYDHKGIGYANARVGADCGSGETQAAMWRGQDRDKYTETKTSSSSYNCTKRQSSYPSGWRTIKVERVSSSQVKFYETGSLIGTHTSYIPTGSLRIRFSAYTYTLAPSDYVTIWVDWVKVTQP